MQLERTDKTTLEYFFFRQGKRPVGFLDKLRFIGDVTETARSGIKVFGRLFQKAAPIQRAERWSPLASGETPYR